jgi:hypothetical protein
MVCEGLVVVQLVKALYYMLETSQVLIPSWVIGIFFIDSTLLAATRPWGQLSHFQK